jgi:alpha-L-fucosidase
MNGDDGVRIAVPARAPDLIDSVIALTIAGLPEIEPFMIRESAGGVVLLPASDATIHGETARYESGGGKDNIGYWSETDEWVSWPFRVARPGRFRVVLDYACAPDNGGTFRLSVAGAELAGRAESTGSWTAFASLELGKIEIAHPGSCQLKVRPVEILAGALMNLKCVQLERIHGDD